MRFSGSRLVKRLVEDLTSRLDVLSGCHVALVLIPWTSWPLIVGHFLDYPHPKWTQPAAWETDPQDELKLTKQGPSRYWLQQNIPDLNWNADAHASTFAFLLIAINTLNSEEKTLLWLQISAPRPTAVEMYNVCIDFPLSVLMKGVTKAGSDYIYNFFSNSWEEFRLWSLYKFD